MDFFLLTGLKLASDIALPGVSRAPEDSASPDVIVTLGHVPAALDAPAAKGPNWEFQGSRFLLQVPGIARYLIEDGRSICVAPEPGANPRDVALFVAGSALGILLHQRNCVVLHASAVKIGGHAVLFCGPSGAGKSTLAAVLNRRGYPLISDDLCAILPGSDGIPMVLPDGRCLKLWDEAVEQLGLGAFRGEAVRSVLQKYFVEPQNAEARPVPVGRVYALQDARASRSPGIARPHLADAALLVQNNAYRLQLVHRLGQQAAYFAACAKIVRSAGVYTFTRKMDFAAMDGAVASLEAHWLETGLLAGAV